MADGRESQGPRYHKVLRIVKMGKSSKVTLCIGVKFARGAFTLGLNQYWWEGT
jgi:hypothetical protein